MENGVREKLVAKRARLGAPSALVANFTYLRQKSAGFFAKYYFFH